MEDFVWLKINYSNYAKTKDEESKGGNPPHTIC